MKILQKQYIIIYEDAEGIYYDKWDNVKEPGYKFLQRHNTYTEKKLYQGYMDYIDEYIKRLQETKKKRTN